MKRITLVFLMVACLGMGWAAELPITNVVLFSSGVGYFERSGTVLNDATVQLSFKPEQINDLLKSLVLLDLDGGKVGAVTYGAKEPLSKTLQAFAVNITDNPSLAQLLNRLRGVPIEVTATNTITGKILGVEIKKKIVDKETFEFEILNILTDTGLRSVRLEEVTSLRLLDERLNKELQDALLVVASGLDNQRKPVLITFNGTGERRVVIGYLMETPIWKTSYRLVLGEKENLLQGWAIVENTGDADWKNVRLSLVSGRPISFIQDLYTPLYVPRPLVKPDLYVSLRPVEYAGDGDDTFIASGMVRTGTLPANMTNTYDISRLNDTNGGKVAANNAQILFQATNDGRQQNNAQFNGWNQKDAVNQLRSSVVSAAKSSDLGQAFRYTIKEKVDLPRQQSALLPIVTGEVDAWKVSIFNPEVHGKFPLYGLRLKNTTGQHLMGGPITVYNNNVYAGDATFEDLQPSEQRLISYAIDLGMEGEQKVKEANAEILAFKIVKGTLYVNRKYHREVEYSFKVKDGKERTIIVEHAFNQGWKLMEPEKADEKTDRFYRFTLRLGDKQTSKLTVVEETTAQEGSVITSIDSDTIVAYMKHGKISLVVKNALEQVTQKQSELLEITRKKALYQQEIQGITNEQQRIRSNMNALNQGSDLYKRYVTKLGEQETRIERLRGLIEDLQEREESQRKELNAYVAGLTLEER
ncbi:MAG: hypothetical protein ACYDBB_18165 [Armatimonadota bacterium]